MSDVTTNPLFGKTIVFLRTSSTARVAPYKHIKACGAKLVMVHPFINHYFDDIFDLWIECETTNIDEISEKLFPAMEAAGLVADTVCSFDEFGVYPAAQLNERLQKRPIPFSSERIRSTNIKSTFRQHCREHHLNSPKSASVFEGDDKFAAAIEAAGLVFPIVMKPSPGAGSLMAKLCVDLDEVMHHGKMMWAALLVHKDVKHYKALGTTQHIMLEEFIGGQEVDIDCCVVNGEVKFAAISDNFETMPPYFVEVGGLCPSELAPAHHEALHQLLVDYVKTCGKEITGVLHFEAKYDFNRGRAYVIEVNCRMGSAETWTMVKNAYGVDLAECFVRCALGLPVDDLFDTYVRNGRTHIQYCASVNIYPNDYGVLKQAEIVKDDDFLDGLVGSDNGSIVGPPPKVFFMLCWMAAKGQTPEAAKANIQRLTRNFIQEIEPLETLTH